MLLILKIHTNFVQKQGEKKKFKLMKYIKSNILFDILKFIKDIKHF